MRRTRRGFTLVEVAIVVAIIGILASIAIPRYRSMQLRAKRAELPMNVDGIKVAELAYDAEYGKFQATMATPTLMPEGDPVEWDSDHTGFELLGFKPDGLVRGQYVVNVSETDFTVIGQSDIDADGHYAELRATKDTEPDFTTADDVY